MAQKQPDKGGGPSLETLVVASLASVTAMIVTSHLWKAGTVISAAMTPVIVTLASEALRRPARKVTQLRPPARRFTPAAGSRPGSRARAESGRPRPHVTSGEVETRTAPVLDDRGWSGNGRGNGDDARSEVRFYRRRNLHVKAAVVTGLVAFVIGALALTVPELIFGGSVSTGKRTTLFGGHSGRSTSKQERQTQPQQTQEQQTTQESPTPTTPDQAPAQTTPAEPPAQTAPAPAPQGSPAPGGGTAPPAQTAPTP
jgi:hypothetical protein